ncbi:hypothetical protein GOP47_0018470 [Adiantum capillus-veneris]|uniref:Uncharacterized protein n=1 Tax=Adiantum capillus-veneris TaxID=13818 RepID=A0A9D4ZAQ9_ADICA|nr:hypothetical protein GOP47_0018470 [Adiantum capillus-veneris]
MSERAFENNMMDFVEGEDGGGGVGVTTRKSGFTEPRSLLAAALSLKDEVVISTWSRRGVRVHDPTLYTGALGTAFLCFRCFEAMGSVKDLSLCLEITDSCAASAAHLKQYFSFICGQAGIYSLGAAAAKLSGDEQRLIFYLGFFSQIANTADLAVGPEEGGFGLPYELLYGRVGLLWASLFVNKYVGEETIPWSTTGPITDAILAAGRAAASHHGSCPLMYQWHGTRYWGAAHGLAGIMHVLMHFPLSKADAEDVKGTLLYMIRHRFLTGNYPSSEGNAKDRLVQWCHGAAGIGLTMCKAAEVFPMVAEFKDAAVDAGDVVWRRGLLRKAGLCHGVSGNAYLFLALHRLTGDRRHLHRAKAFSNFMYEHGLNLISTGQMHGGDHPFSLFEGSAGIACLWLDILRPEYARFPGYEL